jgi:phosphoglycerate dehydrogenase-like enzyme
MTKVAVLDDWQGVAESLADWSALKKRAEVTFFRDVFADADAAAKALAGYQVVLAMRERTLLNKALIDRLRDLKLLTFTAPRNASVDVAACTSRGILVCNTQPLRPSHDTAELALGLLLAAARGIAKGDAEMRAGHFQQNVKPGLGLYGRTLGVIGLGKIGARVAGYGKALGMEVLAWSSNLTAERAAEVGVTRATKEELLARSDAITLHLVLSDRTRGIIGAADLARMKQGAILVNTSRGPLVDQAALLEVLRAGRIIGAIDVYDREPLPAGDPIRALPSTVLSPHVGYVTAQNMTDFYVSSIENIMAWLDGKPIRVVNAEVLAA